ncbi:MAG TPA: DUF5050 domain-containing protein [Clostridiales bacterium]|nr:DUF5050 domain-containing protein [Clostridiales bacterium]
MPWNGMKFNSLKRRCFTVLLFALIPFFAVGCSDTKEKTTAESSPDGINNIDCGGLSVSQGDTIYYVGEGDQGGEVIYAMDSAGENLRAVYTPERYLNWLSDLNIHDNRLYFCEAVINADFGQEETQINVLELADLSVKKLYSSELLLPPIYFYKDHVYFGESRPITNEADIEADPYSDYQLKVMDADGENLITLLNYHEKFLVYDDMIYYITIKGLSRCDLKGQGREFIYDDDNGIAGLQVVDDRLYFVEYRNERASRFMSMDLDGGNPQRVFWSEVRGGVYLANAKDHNIYLGTEEYVSVNLMATHLLTIRLDGSGKGTVVSREDKEIPGYVWPGWCVSGAWLFYAESDGHNGRVLYKEPWTK